MWDLLKELLVYAKLAHPTLLAIWFYVADFVTGRRSKFSPDTDIADLSGKVVLLTGGNGGIGKESLLQLAKHSPSRIFLAARDGKKAQHAISNIKQEKSDVEISFVQLDLTSFDSILKAAKEIREQCSRLDILILNAGIMATPYDVTPEGYEAQIGTNHLGHALLTKLLLPLLVSTSETPGSDVRIVSVSSIGHHMAPSGGILFKQEAVKALTPAQLYGQSKLANILHVRGLAKRYPTITSAAVHPGIIKTELYNPVKKAIWLVSFAIQLFGGLVFADVQFGALNQLWAATAPRNEVNNGKYYMPIGKAIGASKYAKDEGLADRLWDWTEAQFKTHGVADEKKDS